jgi:SAM-dependent methyltransferase
MCEVGAGDSLLAGWLVRQGYNLTGLLVTDASPSMLAYSGRWADRGASLAVAHASDLPVADGSLDLLVASLADPYDDSAWWSEASRVLAPTGSIVLTTPSIGWASAFREAAGEPSLCARFLRSDGTTVDMPSQVRHAGDERKLISDAGLRLVAEDAIRRGELASPVSPKLDVVAADDTIVVGYVATQ